MTKYNFINYNKGNCMVFEEKKECFIPIPKNASTTFRKYFEWQNVPLSSFTKNPEILLNNKVFTIIREPIDRFCSGYIEIVDRKNKNKEVELYEFFKITDRKDKFIQFVEDVHVCFFDSHIVPQTFFLTGEQGDMIKIDETLLLSQVSKKIEELFDKKPKKKRPQIHQNKTRSRRKQIIKSYVEENIQLKKRIEKLYYKDFELYEKTRKEFK